MMDSVLTADIANARHTELMHDGNCSVFFFIIFLSFFLTPPFLFLALLSVTRLHCFNSNCFKLHQFPGLLLSFSGVTPSFSCSVLYVIVTFVICYWLTLYFLHTSKSRLDQRGEHLGRRERESEAV